MATRQRLPYELPIDPIPSDRFQFRKMQFVAEASELGHFRIERLYNDACDVGIAIQSAKTGQIVRFYLVREDRDIEGEARAWEFAPVERDCPNDSTRLVRVVIFND